MSEQSAVDRIMSRPPVTVPSGTTLAEAARIMLDGNIGSLLCVDGAGKLVGIVTDSDFASRKVGIPFSDFRAPTVLGQWIEGGGVERIYERARERQVDEIMTTPVHCVETGADLEAVLRVMLDKNIKHVPIVRDGRPFGIVTRHDLLKLLVGEPPG